MMAVALAGTMAKHEEHIQQLKSHPLFASLTHAELEKLYGLTQEITLNAHETLIHEGSASNELYFILSGELSVHKKGGGAYQRGQLKETSHTISTHQAGDVIGEIALFDHGTRSASVKAATPCTLLRIKYEDLSRLAEANPDFYKLLLNICKNISLHLRHTNDVTISALEKSVAEYSMRITMSSFMINMIIAFCVYSFLLSGLNLISKPSTLSTIITIPLTLFFLVLIYLIIRSSNLPWRLFGFTTVHWKRSLVDVIMTAPIIMAGIVLVKIALIQYVPEYMGRSIIDPYKYIIVSKTSFFSQQSLWWVIMLSYWFITSPIQEIIVRGGLQGSLEYFLVSKNKSLQAIFISNIIFSTMHLFISFQVTFLVFIGGLYFGWLYSRTKTLIGVTFAHALLGTWLLGIIGI